MQQESNCIFCHIVAGEAPASFVYRDETVSAFLDVQPVVTGHVLVIPNYHTADLAGLDDGSGSRMFVIGRRIAAGLRASGLPCEGVNLFLADGAIAGQTVFHSHLHVIPRYAGDGFGLSIPPLTRGAPARAELDDQAERIRDGLAPQDR